VLTPQEAKPRRWLSRCFKPPPKAETVFFFVVVVVVFKVSSRSSLVFERKLNF